MDIECRLKLEVNCWRFIEEISIYLLGLEFKRVVMIIIEFGKVLNKGSFLFIRDYYY